MTIIGLAGGIASGKSTVARELNSLGATLLDADRLGHQVLLLPHIQQRLVEEFGSNILDASGEIDRSKIARRVFGETPLHAASLERLEFITHPEITRLMREHLSRLRDEGTKVVVLDAPVMFKAGWDRLCDHILFVDTSEEVRLSRALARGWTIEQFHSREAAQTSLEEKLSAATTVFRNDSDLETLRQLVRAFWKSLFEDRDSGVAVSPTFRTATSLGSEAHVKPMAGDSP